MDRRTFIKATTSLAALAGVGIRDAQGFIPAHNWDGYDFGPGPEVNDRLNQGPFPIYAPEEVVPNSEVVMATTPSDKLISNFGMGMTTYLCDEAGPAKRAGEDLQTSLEKLIKLDLGQKLYIRLDWRDIQSKAGRLDLCDHWRIAFDLAQKYGKRIGIRVQLMSPVIEPHSVPDFLAAKIPFVKLGKTKEIGIKGKTHYAPRYDHPEFLKAFKELDDLLAAEYNGHPNIEFVDTCMYGFWGEGHTWPFESNPFPDYQTAEKTNLEMFNHQLQNWTRTPLVTNTQPDWSRVGNSEVLDRTIRTHNWLRTDTIFIENMQVESLSNRPPWVATVLEKGMSDGSPKSLRINEGIPISDSVFYHFKDIGAHYGSLWNWHKIQAERILNYYNQFPNAIDDLARNIGYRVRPSWIWHYEKNGIPGIILGMVNDGVAGVPGVLRLTVTNDAGQVLSSGCLDPGYPLPKKVRQAQLVLPKGTDWKGLRVKAEIEVKGQKYPVNWACQQAVNQDGSLTLKPNLR
ncbi:hypothetical protein HQ531_03175 [bacterium]|nr:hypothetical protein [bacterium]